MLKNIMSVKGLFNLVLLYLIVVNLLGYIAIMIEYVYHKTQPNVKSYKSFVLGAMAGNPEHFARFKHTPDYSKLMNATAADSVRYYWNRYKHSD